jgi:hypothetical protein
MPTVASRTSERSDVSSDRAMQAIPSAGSDFFTPAILPYVRHLERRRKILDIILRLLEPCRPSLTAHPRPQATRLRIFWSTSHPTSLPAGQLEYLYKATRRLRTLLVPEILLLYCWN